MLGNTNFQFGLQDDISISYAAGTLFNKALATGRTQRLLSRLIGRTHQLVRLEAVEHGVTHRHFAGMQSVPLRAVRGSLNRTDDFDIDFYPRRESNRRRWMNIAATMLKGGVLPPVELIQVGSVYYVVDGHHRISVARALHQRSIDAVVTVWKV